MSQDTIEYTPLTREDIDAIYQIECACHAYPSSRKVFDGCFNPRYRCFKMTNADVDGKAQVIGFYIAELVLDEMTLQNICISPQRQGKGYGKQLMTHFVQIAKSEKVTQLWLEVRESNTAAIKLYDQFDFAEAGKRKDYYPGENGREDALLMGAFLFLD
ncbi:MAG: ribosomal-protein-alanine N-acetyltransferase [Alteromonadaceae bacterium]|jgi:ribosomal-protein-alanine N-acetyltransferase